MTEANAIVRYEVRWQGATLDVHDDLGAARSQVEAFRAMWHSVNAERASEYAVIEVTVTEREV
jgi:hypothetical protein